MDFLDTAACDFGREVHKTVVAAGYAVVRDLTGHGIGRTINERPTIPNEHETNTTVGSTMF